MIEAQHRHRIHEACSAEARIRLLQEVTSLGGAVFVADLVNGPQHVRLLRALEDCVISPTFPVAG